MHDHHTMEVVSASEPPITVTINPGARVSVALVGILPPPVPCGAATELSVKMANQGFVTALFEALLVGTLPAGVTLAFRPAPLKGQTEEVRKVNIVLTDPAPTDLTIAFRTRNEIPDHGGRDRIHVVLRCREAQ